MYHQSDQYAAPVSIPHQVDGIFTADWMHQLKTGSLYQGGGIYAILKVLEFTLEALKEKT